MSTEQFRRNCKKKSKLTVNIGLLTIENKNEKLNNKFTLFRSNYSSSDFCASMYHPHGRLAFNYFLLILFYLNSSQLHCFCAKNKLEGVGVDD